MSPPLLLAKKKNTKNFWKSPRGSLLFPQEQQNGGWVEREEKVVFKSVMGLGKGKLSEGRSRNVIVDQTVGRPSTGVQKESEYEQGI